MISHPFRRYKDQWGECALLYFCDARVVFSLLFISMNPVDFLGAKISIRVRIGMTHPYIEKMQPSVAPRNPYSGRQGVHQGLG